MTTIHTLVFADHEGSIWGVYWLAAEEGSAPLAYRVDGAAEVVAAQLEQGHHGDPARLEGDGVSLVFAPSGPTRHGGSEDGRIDSLDRVCEVSGSLGLAGSDHPVECLGWHGRVEGSFDLAAIDTFRQTYGWFDPADGIAMLALRPRKSRGQDNDLVAAAVLETEPSPRVVEPRLSSTYDAAGVPSRVGLELWFEADDEPDDDGDHQFPRRAAGEATGDAVRWETGGFRMHAVPIRWHSRGTDGTGVYLLGQRG